MSFQTGTSRAQQSGVHASAPRRLLLAAILFIAASATLVQAQAPQTPPVDRPHGPPASEAFQPPQSFAHPALVLVGDSIVRTGVGTGERGPWGWGAEIIPMFDPAKIHVYNQALGGRSSRGYIEEGAWKKIVSLLQPGDWVMVQFGHNDAANSQNYPDRTTLKGDSNETAEIDSPVTHTREAIHSYGWYLRQYVAEAKAKGANVIILSPPPRNLWLEDKVLRGLDGYASWAADAARVSGARFIDLNTISADKYDKLGQEGARPLFNDPQHSRKAGAKLNAESVVEGLRALKACALSNDLLPPTS